MTLRIRGNHKISSHLERSASLLDMQPQPLEMAILEKFPEIRMEIGCGKGTFLSQIATLHPTVYFIGVEKFVPIIARAAALAVSNELTNVHFYKMDIESALSVFPEHILSYIYLNFSDPWPRRRQGKHRLTHPRFLAIYQQLLDSNGIIELKTDNLAFFEWSIQSLIKTSWIVTDVDRNLAGCAPIDKEGEGQFVHTEYETRFRGLGQPIYFLRAKPPQE